MHACICTGVYVGVYIYICRFVCVYVCVLEACVCVYKKSICLEGTETMGRLANGVTFTGQVEILSTGRYRCRYRNDVTGTGWVAKRLYLHTSYVSMRFRYCQENHNNSCRNLEVSKALAYFKASLFTSVESCQRYKSGVQSSVRKREKQEFVLLRLERERMESGRQDSSGWGLLKK